MKRSLDMKMPLRVAGTMLELLLMGPLEAQLLLTQLLTITAPLPI
jgi:hypothetical protein